MNFSTQTKFCQIKANLKNFNSIVKFVFFLISGTYGLNKTQDKQKQILNKSKITFCTKIRKLLKKNPKSILFSIDFAEFFSVNIVEE